MTIQETDKLDSARRQGQAQFDSIREMVEALEAARSDDDNPNGWGIEDAERTIHEDALSVEVRSAWLLPGDMAPERHVRPAEYRILLCTGGPAVQIIGELSEYGEPETARLQVQDWFTPWTDFRPLVSPDNYDSEPILLAYARCFYFGE